MPNLQSKAAPVGRHCLTKTPPLPRDLDVGVIYTGERDLMGRLLATMKASAPGLNYRLILVDNGIGLVAYLLSSGVPFIVELGSSIDVLLVVVVLQFLMISMRRHSDVDVLTERQELHD